MSDFRRNSEGRWSPIVCDRAPKLIPAEPYRIGILEGEGIGPEVSKAALTVLAAVDNGGPSRFQIRTLVGEEVEDVVGECRTLFAEGGALLAGPKGGRFVYELRRRLDLYCKLSPIAGCPELRGACRLPDGTSNVDILVVRENTMGLYQGRSAEKVAPKDGRVVQHSFCYTERAVRRILSAAAGIARHRRKMLSVVVKQGGLPALSRLWADCAEECAAENDVGYSLVDVDFAGYQLMRHPAEMDVIVAPNLFGDILSDLGGVLVGSRGLTFGGSFGSTQGAVYQTNHGAAHDLAGTDRANPGGHILALAMLLRESFGLFDEAARIESALRRVWASGWRTADLAEDGCRIAGTRQLGSLTAAALVEVRETP